MSVKHPIEIKNKLSGDLLNCLKSLANQQGAEFELSASDFGGMISRPPDSSLGDFCLPCFRFAKSFKLAPPQIAEKLCELVKDQNFPEISRVTTKGAFLNIGLSVSSYHSQVLDHALTDIKSLSKLFQVEKSRVMVEYSQPNTHKVFHIGHVRNVALGDSLSRMLAYCGNDVVPVNYIGDEGTHIAECLWQFDKDPVEASNPERVMELEKRYVAAKQQIASAEEPQKTEFKKQVGSIHHALESKKRTHFDRWVKTKEWCMEEFQEIYTWFDAKFDHIFYESEMTDLSQKLVDEYLEKGVFIKDDGAVGIRFKDEKLGFLMLRKTNGASLYATKDLALAKIKYDQFNIDRSIYVVAHEQSLHFQQVFETLKEMGFPQADQCHHLSYAFVTIPDGKMSARKGNAVHFALVRDAVLVEVMKHLDKYKEDWSNDQLNETAKCLAVAAIRYGMLSMDPNKTIQFKLDEWTSFEGNTGPYLLYSFARSQAVLRKSKDIAHHKGDLVPSELEHEDAVSLVRMIADLDAMILSACDQYRPSALCSHLYQMCRSFNAYYAKVRILDGEDKNAIATRLKLVRGFAASLKKALGLLGIKTVNKM